MEMTDRCWCGHLAIWHVMEVCRWCARMERRRPESNWMPRHTVAAETPRTQRDHLRRAVDAFGARILSADTQERFQ